MSCRFSMLSHIYFCGHSFSFIVVLYYLLVSTADVRSFAQPLFFYFFLSCAGRSGRTGEPGESIVDVSVGR